MSPELGERQGAILNAIVREYITSGEPVGSKHLVGNYRLQVSSATVRNDMSRLEELGYLSHPHTSAGRIPTDLGYRFFVDHVPQPVALDSGQERELERAMLSGGDVEELLHRASEVLSRFTRQAAAVLAPSLSDSKLRHVDLVPLSPRLSLLVLVTHAGRVEKRVLEFADDLPAADSEDAQRVLNEILTDARLSDGKRIVSALNASAQGHRRTVLEGVASALEDIANDESRVFVDGASHLAAEESFGQRDALQRVYEVLEEQRKIVRLLADGLRHDTSVRIGGELEDRDLQACSVVLSSYALDGTPLGTVGVIGPTRMDYTKAMAITRAVARSVQEHLGLIAG